MQHTPQRPFVPERTASVPRNTRGPAAFRLARPFVHGVKRLEPSTVQRSGAAQAAPELPTIRSAPPPLPLVYDPPAEAIPAPPDAAQGPSQDAFSPPNILADPDLLLSPIEQYLQTEPIYSRDASGFGPDSHELPPVEHFMDSLAESEGAPGGNGELMTQAPSLEDADAVANSPEWGDTDWAQYDWRSAAALGEAGDPEANSAWSETDWENAAAPVRDVRETAAKAIADALDGIARRIRDGELVIPSPGSAPNPAAIAATLAALLGVKR